ncbi:MAG: hypothetical protein M3P95_04135, partial [Actinomycetota bacterium]|nr:hypothetical protein [Actinomycetota bacterium]
LLHVAARLADGPAGGPLTDAADAYDRAARTLYRHHPAPTFAGYRLRHATTVLLDTVLTARVRHSNPQLAALLTQLAHLARTLSELRETQQRLHQAKSARLAAEAMRAYGTRLRPRDPGVDAATHARLAARTVTARADVATWWSTPPTPTTDPGRRPAALPQSLHRPGPSLRGP